MKRNNMNLAVVLSLGIVGTMVAGGTAVAGIANTKHNLSYTNTTTTNNRVSNDTSEICAFCHTPHAANLNVEAPLWNKVASTATYTRYASATYDAANGNVGSVSLACLSCHDGTQGMDVMINAPGSRNYNTEGVDPGWIWAGPNVNGTTGALINSAAGAGTDNAIAMLGTDLTNDHPISMMYAAGPSDVTLAASSFGDSATEFKDRDFNTLSTVSLNGKLWWYREVSGSVNSTGRDRKDIILYTRNVSNAGISGYTAAELPFVECASCHDPHVDDATTFLRMSNAGSAVCLACHDK